MTRQSTPLWLEHAITALATDQYGVMSRLQLLALGLSADGIDERVRRGRLLPIHPGVYCVGHRALTNRSRMRAALLASPPGAVLSHFTAAALWELLGPGGPVHVAVPGRTGRLRLDGVAAHRPRSLPHDEVEERGGFAITTLARTLVDLAAVARPAVLDRAVRQSEFHALFDLYAIQRVLARSRGRRGTGRLREVITGLDDLGVTRSELEAAFLALCRDAGVPKPLANTPIAYNGGYHFADFYWPDRRLIIETDGYQAHSTRSAHREDRQRDRRLRRMGYAVERFTWEDVFLDPATTTAEIAGIVARHRSLPGGGVD